MGKIGKVCGWKHLTAPSVRQILDGGRAREAVLTILRDTNLGCMISLAPPEEGEGEDKSGEEGGPGP